MSLAKRPMTPPSVLIVDAERGARESMRLLLEPRFRVTTVESGEQALDVLRYRNMDVVTLDLTLPGRDSIEIFRKIRAMDPDLQIIIVSGESLEDLPHALPHAASAWIPKPIGKRRIVEAVKRAAEETRLGRERTVESRVAAPQEAHAPALEVGDPHRRDAARMISHDLKNRISNILGFVRLLREGQLESWHAAEALDVIEGNAHQAETLTVNFLHVEENEGGSLQLHKTPVSLNQIVEQVMEDVAPRARLKRIDLQVDLDSALPSIDLDIGMISRSVTNILDNALHYSPAGGVVRVETRRFADVMILRIRDHGPGIPAEEVAGLFQRYGRGAKSASGSSTGLGLYLVRTIIEAHDGSVSATFPPDGGTAFVIVLPCPPDGDA